MSAPPEPDRVIRALPTATGQPCRNFREGDHGPRIPGITKSPSRYTPKASPAQPMTVPVSSLTPHTDREHHNHSSTPRPRQPRFPNCSTQPTKPPRSRPHRPVRSHTVQHSPLPRPPPVRQSARQPSTRTHQPPANREGRMNTRYFQARRSIQTLTKTNPNSDRKLSSRSRGAAEEDEARGPVKAGRSDPRNVDEPVASKPWVSGNRWSSPEGGRG